MPTSRGWWSCVRRSRRDRSARELVAGGPCPVCGQDVHKLPKIEVPIDLKAAEKQAASALAAHKKAGEEVALIDRESAVAARDVETLKEQATLLAEALSGHPDFEAVE